MSDARREPWTVEAFPPSPVCWPTLTTGQETSARIDLASWVEWLVQRYELDHRSVPGCWAEHGALVEELSALRGAWAASFAQTANALAPLDWHSNFAATRQRLGDWVSRSGCRPGEHRVASPALVAGSSDQ